MLEQAGQCINGVLEAEQVGIRGYAGPTVPGHVHGCHVADKSEPATKGPHGLSTTGEAVQQEERGTVPVHLDVQVI